MYDIFSGVILQHSLHYSEYWERLVLCNAMVWTCEITSRPNLTYQEALDSEAKGLKFIASISPVSVILYQHDHVFSFSLNSMLAKVTLILV
jgi:bromodomain adjacent to zinc finger domain protein 1A